MMEPSKNMAKICVAADKILVTGESIYKNNNEKREMKKEGGSGIAAERRFFSTFGVNIFVCVVAWDLFERKRIVLEGGSKEHFLWLCLQLIVYPTEFFLFMLLDVDKKTFRKWE